MFCIVSQVFVVTEYLSFHPVNPIFVTKTNFFETISRLNSHYVATDLYGVLLYLACLSIQAPSGKGARYYPSITVVHYTLQLAFLSRPFLYMVFSYSVILSTQYTCKEISAEAVIKRAAMPPTSRLCFSVSLRKTPTKERI